MRALLKKRVHSDWAAVEAELHHLEAEFRHILDAEWHCTCHCGTPPTDTRPVSVTVTASQRGTSMTDFAPGATITFSAATDNAEGVALATDATGQPFTYTWTASAGTIVAGADTTTITISDAPLGEVTVTATDNAGFAGSVTVTVADQTPTSVTVTAA